MNTKILYAITFTLLLVMAASVTYLFLKPTDEYAILQANIVQQDNEAVIFDVTEAKYLSGNSIQWSSVTIELNGELTEDWIKPIGEHVEIGHEFRIEGLTIGNRYTVDVKVNGELTGHYDIFIDSEILESIIEYLP